MTTENERELRPLQIQRTWDFRGNIIFHVLGKRRKEFLEVTLIDRDGETCYVPLEAYEELLAAIAEKRDIVQSRIILAEQK